MKTAWACIYLLSIGCDQDRPIPKTNLTDTEIALEQHCHTQYGRTAFARNEDVVWITCYQGKKKIWSVKR